MTLDEGFPVSFSSKENFLISTLAYTLLLMWPEPFFEIVQFSKVNIREKLGKRPKMYSKKWKFMNHVWKNKMYWIFITININIFDWIFKISTIVKTLVTISTTTGGSSSTFDSKANLYTMVGRSKSTFDWQ